MNPVEQVIWLVENRLVTDGDMAALARETGLSRFALARAFRAATGRTVADYRRARRLTVAARAIAAGAASITDTALSAGFQSHEAFTRAFRRNFGITPEALRRRRDLSGLTLTEAIRMNAEQRTPLDGPVIETLPALDLVGISRSYPPGPLAELPAQWAAFMPHLEALALGGGPFAAYGIVQCATKGRPGDVTYACTVPAATGLQPGGDLVAIRLPAMRVAKFTYRGHISAIKAATGAAFAAMSDIGMAPAAGIDLIEYYGPEFDPRTGFGAYGLWVPVAPG